MVIHLALNVGRVFNDVVHTSLFNITQNGDIVPAASGSIDLGSSSITWDNIYGGTLYTDDKIGHRGDTNTFIRFPSADTFSVETSGSEKFRITSGGDVGIGSTTPTAKLDVDGTLNITGVSTFQDRVIFDNTNSIQIPVGTEAQKDPVGTAVTGQIRFNTTNSTFEGFGSGGQWGSLGGVKDVDGDTFVSAEDSPGSDEDAITFFTAGTEKAVIDSNGKLGIGITNPTSTLDVNGTLNVSGISTFSDVDVTESLTAKQVTADYYGEQHKSFIDIQVTSSASKTANHRYTGVGDNRSFIFDGDEAPYIQFVPGKTYRFDQVDSSNTNHRLKFYLESNKTTEYTTGVTYNGTPGAANAYTQIVVTKQTPSVLYYQSENHDRIGNEVSVVNSFSLLEHNLGIGTVNPLQSICRLVLLKIHLLLLLLVMLASQPQIQPQI